MSFPGLYKNYVIKKSQTVFKFLSNARNNLVSGGNNLVNGGNDLVSGGNELASNGNK